MNRALASRALCTLVLSGLSLAASAQQLTVSAAASLTNVLKELGSRYEASHPGAKLQFNFAASGVLIQQIAQGAPVDVFISADEETISKGFDLKLLSALWGSLQHLAVGFALAFGIALPLGILMGRNPRLNAAVDPIISALYAIPRSPSSPSW